jgi:site-specific recombinase XerD
MDNQIVQVQQNVSVSWNFQFLSATTPAGPSIEKVIGELEIAKRFANKRPEYIKGLVQYLKLFARGRETRSISDFDSFSIESWFASRSEALTTRASNVGRLSSLFSYAVRRKYAKENPCDNLERITVERAEPPVLSPDQIESAIAFALLSPPRVLLWFILAGIVGVRPGELKKMHETDLRRNLTEGLIIIDAMMSKVRNRRIIELTAHSKTWLDYALSEKVKLPFSKSFMRRCRRQLKSHLCLAKWPQDILRHTALSYMLAHHGDEARVARESGNSVKIFRQHYKGLVKPVESAAFQNLLPRARDVGQLELFSRTPHPVPIKRANF